MCQCDSSVGTVALRRWLVRPFAASDMARLMRRAGPMVDALYPRGAEQLHDTLNDAVHGYASAFVVTDHSDTAVGLICEKPKGRRRIKVSTFWIDPSVHGEGAGHFLAAARHRAWSQIDGLEVYGTSRFTRTPAIERVFGPLGFTLIHRSLNRYGDGEHEDVHQWESLVVPDLYSPRAAANLMHRSSTWDSSQYSEGLDLSISQLKSLTSVIRYCLECSGKMQSTAM